MNYPDVFADIGNVNLFCGKTVLHPAELESLPTELIGKPDGKGLIENRLDSRMHYTKGRTEIAILCAENQSDICNVMPVRDMGYQYVNYLQQVKKIQVKEKAERKKLFTKWLPDGTKLKPVITFVLNYSGKKWESPISLKDICKGDKEKLQKFRQDETGLLRIRKNFWTCWMHLQEQETIEQ